MECPVAIATAQADGSLLGGEACRWLLLVIITYQPLMYVVSKLMCKVSWM